MEDFRSNSNWITETMPNPSPVSLFDTLTECEILAQCHPSDNLCKLQPSQTPLVCKTLDLEYVLSIIVRQSLRNTFPALTPNQPRHLLTWNQGILSPFCNSHSSKVAQPSAVKFHSSYLYWNFYPHVETPFLTFKIHSVNKTDSFWWRKEHL